MDSQIEDFILDAIKHPALSIGIIIATIVSIVLVKFIANKVQWIYRREKLFKQLEMKFYGSN